MKSKYNTGSPIDIATLTKRERKKAFHEWAEGSVALEKLLNTGYKKRFPSLACCGGDTGHPYICYDLNDDRSRKMAVAVANKLVESSHDCQITIYDNFMLNDAYPETYPARGITRLHVEALLSNKEEVFNMMSDTIKHANLKNIELPTEPSQLPVKSFKPKEQEKNNITDQLAEKTYSDDELEQNKSESQLSPKVVENKPIEKEID